MSSAAVSPWMRWASRSSPYLHSSCILYESQHRVTTPVPGYRSSNMSSACIPKRENNQKQKAGGFAPTIPCQELFERWRAARQGPSVIHDKSRE